MSLHLPLKEDILSVPYNFLFLLAPITTSTTPQSLSECFVTNQPTKSLYFYYYSPIVWADLDWVQLNESALTSPLRDSFLDGVLHPSRPHGCFIIVGLDCWGIFS